MENRDLWGSNTVIEDLLASTRFLIPCFLLDIINSIYTELKATPQIAYQLFTIEMIIILAVIAGPVITSTLYKHHPNTNIKIMKQTLDSEYNSLDQKQNGLIIKENSSDVSQGINPWQIAAIVLICNMLLLF